MVGYVLAGPIHDLANEIAAQMKSLPERPKLVRQTALGRLRDHFLSAHERDCGVSPFTLHHLLFDLG